MMNENIETSGVPERPAFLTVLCVLSYIASGGYLLLMLIVGLMKGSFESENDQTFVQALVENAREQNPEIEGIDEVSAYLEVFFSSLYMISTVVLTLITVYGVMKMWNLKKQGFFIYAAAGVIGLILPMLFGIPFSMAGLVLTGLFIMLYYLNTKVMS
jgi:hypothetical protein